MEMLTHAIGWFEIPVSDFDRAKKFYSAIYDYDMPEMQMGPNRMGFLLSDQQAGVGGAIVQGEGYTPSHHGPKVYLNGGSDLNVVLNRVEAAGGKVILPKTMITEEYGFFAIFEDSEKNLMHLHSAR